MTLEERLGVLVALGFAAMLLLQRCGRDRAEPAHITKTADSLEATRPALDSQLARSARAGDSSAKAQRRIQRLEQQARARADSLARVADSLAAIAAASKTAQDSARHYAAAYDRAQASNDELRTALAQKDERITLLVADTTRLSIDKDSALARLSAVEAFNDRLRRELAVARRRTWRDRLGPCAGAGYGVDVERRVARTAFLGGCVLLSGSRR